MKICEDPKSMRQRPMDQAEEKFRVRKKKKTEQLSFVGSRRILLLSQRPVSRNANVFRSSLGATFENFVMFLRHLFAHCAFLAGLVK